MMHACAKTSQKNLRCDSGELLPGRVEKRFHARTANTIESHFPFRDVGKGAPAALGAAIRVIQNGGPAGPPYPSPSGRRKRCSPRRGIFSTSGKLSTEVMKTEVNEDQRIGLNSKGLAPS
jgi:hypothetical protein